MKRFLILALLIVGTTKAQLPSQIEQSCPGGTTPVANGQTLDGATQKFRQWLCTDFQGNIYFFGDNVNGAVMADRAIGSDFSVKVNNALAIATANSNSQAVVNACNFTTPQTISTNPFNNISGPFLLLWPLTTVTTSVPLYVSSSQQVVRACSVNGQSPQLLAGASFPNIAISSVNLSANVVTVTTSVNHPYQNNQLVCIGGTTDHTTEGCFFVTRTGNTTFTYPLTLSNRSSSGGTASPPIISIGTTPGVVSQGSRVDSLTINANGNPFGVASINGSELSGFLNVIVTNYTQSCLYNFGPAAVAGAGNTENDHIFCLFQNGASPYASVWHSNGANPRFALRDATIAANGSGTGQNAILVSQASADLETVHVENHTNGLHSAIASSVHCHSFQGFNTVVTSILIDVAGATSIDCSDVSQGTANSLVNNQTGTSIGINRIIHYSYSGNSPNNAHENYQLADANGGTFFRNSGTGGVIWNIATPLASASCPTISSGFGTGPSVANCNGSMSFTVNVGTGGVATSGVLSMPFTASHNWGCSVSDNGTGTSTHQSANTTNTVTLTALAAWTTATSLQLSCTAN